MARTGSREEVLSQSLEASGGLQNFRAVADRPKTERDGPFGPPAERPAVSPPKVLASPVKRETPPVEPRPVVAAPLRVDTVAATPKLSKRPEPADADPIENVTVPLTRSLRDRSEELAKLLNRSRTIRKSRITRNTVIRVALESFLETFKPTSSESVNSEADLLKAALSARRK